MSDVSTTQRPARSVDRRHFLRLCGLAGSGLLLAACQSATPAPTAAPAASKPTEAPKPAATTAPAAAPAAASPAVAPAAPTSSAAQQAPAAASGQKITVRVVSSQQKTQEAFKVIQRWGDAVSKATNGAVDFKLDAPDAIPGGEKDALEGLRTTHVFDAIHVTTTILSTIEPQYGLTDLPFIFKDRDTAFKILDGQVGQTLDDALTKTGMRPLMRTYGLFRHADLRTKPVNAVADFKGVKIRTIQADIPLRTFQLLGANPVPMASTEVYTALQTGVLDAWEAPLDAIYALKNYEVAKYISLTGHQYVDVVLVMDEAFYQKAPKDVQSAFTSAAKGLVAEHRKLMTDTEQQAVKDLTAAGAQINDVTDKKPFQDAVAPIYEDVGKKNNYFDLITQVRAAQ